MSTATEAWEDVAGGESTEQLQQALLARARGWRVFPLDHPDAGLRCVGAHPPDWDRSRCDVHRGKCPCRCGTGEDGRGIQWGAATAREQADTQLLGWFGDPRQPRNVGIACGPSRLWVVDEDRDDALVRLAAALGETIPPTYRVRTARGWHYYFERPDGVELGNDAGSLADYGMDVRGSMGRHGYGGYVVGAGSTHLSGHVYEAEEEHTLPAVVPGWLIEAVRRPSAQKAAQRPAARGASAGGWDELPRYGTPVEFLSQYQRHLDEVIGKGDPFRKQLFAAARDGWRLRDRNLLSAEQFNADLAKCVRRVWGADPDDNDKLIVKGEARQAATASPWVLYDSPATTLPQMLDVGADGNRTVSGTGSTESDTPSSDPLNNGRTNPSIGSRVTAPDEGGHSSEQVTPEDIRAYELEQAFERAVSEGIRKADIAEEVKRRRKARDRPVLVRLSGSAFLKAPQVEYLVPSLLWRKGSSRVFGPPGSTKSFFLLDLALSLATGTPWRGLSLPRVRVHYVMAEGQEVNVTRTLAWLHARGVDEGELDSWFVAYPAAVLLTPEGIEDYLRDAAEDLPGLVVLDTKARMMEGSPNSPDDNSVLVRAVDMIKNVTGGNVCLVDHTGVHDTTRAKGDNTVLAATDTEIRVTQSASGLNVAEVTRDKASEFGDEFVYRLAPVFGVPGVNSKKPPVVVEPVDGTTARGAFLRASEWTDIVQPDLPEDVARYDKKGEKAIRQLARFMRHQATGGIGFTMAEARRAVLAAYLDDRGKPLFAPDTVDRSWGALIELGRIELAEGNRSSGRSRWVPRKGDPE